MLHTFFNFKKQKILANRRGFTLVELLVVVAIGAIILIALTRFERDIYYLNSVQSSSLLSAGDAQNILNTMVKELRSATPGSDGSYPIVTTGTSTFTFFSDNNGDGVSEKITYTLVGTTLFKSVVAPTGIPLSYPNATGTVFTLASNVRNARNVNVFDYFDSNYTGTSSPLAQPITASNVRLVRITLVLNTNPNVPVAPVTYTSQVGLRNLKNNL